MYAYMYLHAIRQFRVMMIISITALFGCCTVVLIHITDDCVIHWACATDSTVVSVSYRCEVEVS